MKSKIPQPKDILSKQLKQLQQQNKSYSLRALSRDLDLSVSFVSGLLSGKKPVPTARLKDIKRVMKMDEVVRSLLDQSLEQEALSKFPNLKREMQQNPFRSSVVDYTEIARKQAPIYSHWYNIAIMDLVTCTNFVDDPTVVARRLGITSAQAKASLQFLERENFIHREGNRFVKTSEKMRFPTAHSIESIRAFHTQMMQIAAKKLLSETSQESFQARLINGVTFAANPAHLEKAKARLNDALCEIAEILAEGECTEVYHLSSQLMPLTKA